jgi:hypothetical protein
LDQQRATPLQFSLRNRQGGHAPDEQSGWDIVTCPNLVEYQAAKQQAAGEVGDDLEHDGRHKCSLPRAEAVGNAHQHKAMRGEQVTPEPQYTLTCATRFVPRRDWVDQQERRADKQRKHGWEDIQDLAARHDNR